MAGTKQWNAGTAAARAKGIARLQAELDTRQAAGENIAEIMSDQYDLQLEREGMERGMTLGGLWDKARKPFAQLFVNPRAAAKGPAADVAHAIDAATAVSRCPTWRNNAPTACWLGSRQHSGANSASASCSISSKRRPTAKRRAIRQPPHGSCSMPKCYAPSCRPMSRSSPGFNRRFNGMSARFRRTVKKPPQPPGSSRRRSGVHRSGPTSDWCGTYRPPSDRQWWGRSPCAQKSHQPRRPRLARRSGT